MGRQTVEYDKFVRNLMVNELSENDVNNLNPETKEFLQSYCDGINDAR